MKVISASRRGSVKSRTIMALIPTNVSGAEVQQLFFDKREVSTKKGGVDVDSDMDHDGSDGSDGDKVI